MAGTFDISTINVISPNGLVTKPLTVDNYGYAKIGDERVGVTPQNWIINGQFDVWQRGTSQTSSGYGSDDRWSNEHYLSTKTHSRQAFVLGQTDVPNNPKYFSRTIVTTANSADAITYNNQRIEDVSKLAGKTITLSFWAKADSSKNMSIDFEQNFGAGGSAGIAFSPQKFALTTSWQRLTKTLTVPSVSGKTIGDGNFFRIMFWFDAGSDYASRTDSLGNQSGTFDIANVCLVEGSVPVECPNEPYAEVLRKCQRYYQRFSGTSAYSLMSGSGTAYSTTGVSAVFDFAVPMRVAPASVEYANIGTAHPSSPVYAVTSMALSSSTTVSKASLDATIGTASLSQWRPAILLGNNNASAYVAFPAEL